MSRRTLMYILIGVAVYFVFFHRTVAAAVSTAAVSTATPLSAFHFSISGGESGRGCPPGLYC